MPEKETPEGFHEIFYMCYLFSSMKTSKILTFSFHTNSVEIYLNEHF